MPCQPAAFLAGALFQRHLPRGEGCRCRVLAAAKDHHLRGGGSRRREGPRGQYGRWHRFVVVVVVVVVTLWLGLGSFTGALRKESHPEEKDHLKVRRFFWESLRRFVSITMFDDFLKEFLLKTVVEDRGTLSKEVWMRNFRVTKF